MRSRNTPYTPTSTPSPTCLAAKPCSRLSKSQISPPLISPKDRAFLWSLVRSTFASRYPVVHLKTRIGDFEEIYGAEHTDEDEPQAGKWDAVLTCFFIDTVRPTLHVHTDGQPLIIATGQKHRQLSSCPAPHPCTWWRLDQPR